jgi:hypothetical protein
MVDFYDDGAARIQRVDGGYVLVITGSAGKTTLLIRNDGGMIDASGAPVNKGDIMIAKEYLRAVDGAHLVNALRPVTLSGAAAAAIRRRMLS